MNRILLPLLLATVLAAGCRKDPFVCTDCDPGRDNQDTLQKVLVIGIDGCRSDALQQASTPNLDQLAATGAWSYHVDRGPYTWSAPGWSTILCGVWPDKHGVTFNTFSGKNYGQYPPFSDRVRDAWGCLNFGTFTHFIALNHHLLTHNSVNFGIKSDRLVTDNALEYFRSCNPDIVFVHLGEVDHIGHLKGFDPSVPEYISKIEQSDRFAGELIDMVRWREQYFPEKWLIAVVTDHGGTMSGHGGKDDIPEVRYVFMILNGPGIIPGQLQPDPVAVDLVPTILTYLNIPVDPAWQLDGQAVGF